MTQINTQYREGADQPVQLRKLKDDTYFRLEDGGQTVWRLLGFADNAQVKVLNLDDLSIERMNSSVVVKPVEINSIDIKVELV